MGNTPNANLEKQLDNLTEKDRLCGFINVLHFLIEILITKTNNICYANSVLQCLYSLKLFKTRVINQKQVKH